MLYVAALHCASDQKKFLDFYPASVDSLQPYITVFDRKRSESVARESGLDIPTFLSCIDGISAWEQRLVEAKNRISNKHTLAEYNYVANRSLSSNYSLYTEIEKRIQKKLEAVRKVSQGKAQ